MGPVGTAVRMQIRGAVFATAVTELWRDGARSDVPSLRSTDELVFRDGSRPDADPLDSLAARACRRHRGVESIRPPLDNRRREAPVSVIPWTSDCSLRFS